MREEDLPHGFALRQAVKPLVHLIKADALSLPAALKLNGSELI